MCTNFSGGFNYSIHTDNVLRPATSLIQILNTLALTLTNATRTAVATHVTILMLIKFFPIMLVLFTVQDNNLGLPVIGLHFKILTIAPMYLTLNL